MKAWFLRAAFFGVPLLVLGLSILALHSGSILKRPLGSDDDVPTAMNRLSDLALADQWDEADRAYEDLEKAWEQVKGRTRLSLGAEEVGIFDLELAGLHGAVESRDPTEVRIALRRLMGLWDDLGS